MGGVATDWPDDRTPPRRADRGRRHMTAPRGTAVVPGASAGIGAACPSISSVGTVAELKEVIALARAGKTFTVPADKSILEVLRANGFKIKTLCKEGVCGTCRVGLLSGKADHRDEVLTDEQREHEIQVCVSRALPNQTLVLDL